MEEPDFSANGRWQIFRADDALLGGIDYGGDGRPRSVGVAITRPGG